MDILQETDEDAFLGIEQAPGIQGPEVIRQRLEAGASDSPQKLLLGGGTRRPPLYLVEAHHGLRPETLYRVAHHEDYLRVRSQSVYPGDPCLFLCRLASRNPARHRPTGLPQD